MVLWLVVGRVFGDAGSNQRLVLMDIVMQLWVFVRTFVKLCVSTMEERKEK
jgi:hypothetical protein